jgi:hypothetical protein
MLFRFFKHKDIEDFAKSLTERFSKRFPTELAADTSPAAAQKREAAMTSMHSLVADFHKRTPLGLYKRAELANTMKWELKARGYQKDFVNAVVYDMLIELASKKKS